MATLLTAQLGSVSVNNLNNKLGGQKMSMYISDVNISVLRSELERECNILTNNNGWSHTFKDQRTRAGKEVSTLIDNDNSAELVMFYDNQTGIMTIKPHKFGTKNYATGNMENIIDVLSTFCAKGTKYKLSYYTDGGLSYIVQDGSTIDGQIKVVKKGNLEDFDDDPSSGGTGDAYKVKVPIKQFLDDNQSIKAQIYSSIAPAKDMTSFVNALGKYLISEKGNGQIEFALFRDILNQCVILGANDPTVLKIRALIM